jgi:hypothetical protein
MNNEYVTVGGIKIGRKPRSTLRKHTPVLLSPKSNPYNMNQVRALAAIISCNDHFTLLFHSANNMSSASNTSGNKYWSTFLSYIIHRTENQTIRGRGQKKRQQGDLISLTNLGGIHRQTDRQRRIYRQQGDLISPKNLGGYTNGQTEADTQTAR